MVTQSPSRSKVKVEKISNTPARGITSASRPSDFTTNRPGPSGFASSNRAVYNDLSAGQPGPSGLVSRQAGPSGLASRQAGPRAHAMGREQGPRYVDLTAPQSGQPHIQKINLANESHSHSISASPIKLYSIQDESRTHPRSRGSSSPTTQAMNDISTITIDDDTTLSDITLTSPDAINEHDLVNTLVEVGNTSGYDEMEIAQALSLYECKDLDKPVFFKLLKQVRKDSNPSPLVAATLGTANNNMDVPKPKPSRRTTNVALESIHKRQPTSPTPAPTGKRVKTVTSTSERLRIEPTEPTEPSVTTRFRQPLPVDPTFQPQQPEIVDLPQASTHQSQLHEVRQQQHQRYHDSHAGISRLSDLSQPSTSQYGQPPIAAHSTQQQYGQPTTTGYTNVHTFRQPPITTHTNSQPHRQPPLPPPEREPSLPPLPVAPELPARSAPNTRMVVIDGSNIAYGHGKKFYSGHERIFSSEGILIAINYLKSTYGANKENIKAIVPNFRRRNRLTRDPHLLDNMEDSGYLVFSPCKTMPDGKKIVPYDDRFILDLAVATDGVVISNDKYADLIDEKNGKYRDVINNRVIMFMFVEDMFMIPEDPMGRYGPALESLLRPRSSNTHLRAPTEVKSVQPLSANYQAPTLVASYQPTNRYTVLGDQHSGNITGTSVPARQRSHAETQTLSSTLMEIFPEASNIQHLLKRHPHERDVEHFIQLLLNN